MQDQADRKLEASLDKSEYDESQLIEIRVAMNLPYQQRFTDFERAYGEVELNGKTYTYVKRKVDGDVVILKCIPNESKQQLRSIDNDLTRANSDINNDHQGKQQQSSFAKNFWSEYDGQVDLFTLNKLIGLDSTLPSCYTFYLPEVVKSTPHQPPEC